MESDSQTGSQTVRRDLVKLAGWTGPASKSKQVPILVLYLCCLSVLTYALMMVKAQ